MPTKLVEALKDQKLKVTLKSTGDLTIKLAFITLMDHMPDDDRNCLGVLILSEDAIKFQAEAEAKKKTQKKKLHAPSTAHEVEEKPIRMYGIPLDEILELKARTYSETTKGGARKSIHALQVVREDKKTMQEGIGYTQVIFTFDRMDDRDVYVDGLNAMMTHNRWALHQPRIQNKLRLIKTIEECNPEQGEMIRFKVTVGEYEPTIFSVPEDAMLKEDAARKKTLIEKVTSKLPININERHSSDLLKELVEAFCLHNFVLPAEGVSLYRYARAIISRLIMEIETQALTKEIDKLRMKTQEIVKYHPAEIRAKVEADDNKLRLLGSNIKYRIGNHGPAAPLITTILQRTIDKTRHFNSTHAKRFLGSGETGGQGVDGGDENESGR